MNANIVKVKSENEAKTKALADQKNQEQEIKEKMA